MGTKAPKTLVGVRLRTLLVVTVASLTASMLLSMPAAAKKGKKTRPDSSPQVDLRWPPPPQPTRILFEKSYSGEADFKKKPKRWKRVLLGQDTESGIALRKPYGVATDAAGRVYVTDTQLGAVLVFDEAAGEVRIVGGSGQARLVTPIGVAIDDRGRIFVSDASLNQVYCLDSEDHLLLALGSAEGLLNPTGLAIDAQRQRLYVADSHLHKIFVYSLEGEFLEARGSRGSGEGQFNFPTNLTVDAVGNLYVVDTGNFRVQIFDPEGQVVSSFGSAGDGFGNFHRPKGIALDSENHIYVSDAAFNNFQVFDPTGQLLLFVGTLGSDLGNFWLPAGMHIDANDRIYVVDQINSRVQVFQYLSEKSSRRSDTTGSGVGAEE